MAFYANGFTTFGAYKKIGGDNVEAQPIEPAAGAIVFNFIYTTPSILTI